MVIRGIGVDVCRISRMNKMTLESRFVERFFSEEERSYLAGKGVGFRQSLAGLYAAKEAFAKALGSGVRGFELKEVEILHTAEGQPYYRVSGAALAVQQERKIEQVFLSISHDAGIAAAFAVAWGSQTDEA
ncbi:MAG: holo-ACP synthase [Lachnospiraceae bacterium]|nr:holo-ACP synthase [Lachnospiraceae bacterium]